MKKNWIRKVVGGLSLTSVLFVFQACYGTPQDFEHDILVEVNVKSKTTNLPIEGIKVSVPSIMRYGYTDSTGHLSFYTELMDEMRITFEDIDSTQNGQYLNTDTLITEFENQISLDIKLEDQ